MEKKVLTLSVKKEWFDMISAGEKKEEYREIKLFWIRRLADSTDGFVLRNFVGITQKFKPYTHVLFINGYGNDKPRIEKEIESIDIDRPRKGWCPDDFLGKEFFVIKFKW